MTRPGSARILLALLGALLLHPLAACRPERSAPSRPERRPPNIVLVISDDQGWTDYGFMGHPVIRTPHLDRLAGQSRVLTRGYTTSSFCRPSLASLMTGLHPHQHGITGNDPDGPPRDPENRERMVRIFRRARPLTDLLRDGAGYLSHQSGKWWEGACRCTFDVCMSDGRPGQGWRHGGEGLRIGRQTMEPVLEFIDGAGDRPFFLWFAPYLPHTPHDPPERLLARYRSDDRSDALARYYAMVEWLDQSVGQLLAHLERRGLARDTLVVFLSDNGWIQPEPPQKWIDLRAKSSPYDAGSRTPILLRWPGVIEPGRDEESLASGVDLVPTLLRVAGIPVPEALPGVDLLDHERLAARRHVFGAVYAHTAVDIHDPLRNLKARWVIRRDGWKLIEFHPANAGVALMAPAPDPPWLGEAPQLFQLREDPFEEWDRAGGRPALVDELARELERWWTIRSGG